MRGCFAAVVVSLLFYVGCGGDSSPTSPSPSPDPTPSAPTRIISISGSLAFGNVTVGQTRDLSFTITNSGNSALTVNNLAITSGLGSIYTSDFASGGTIAASASRSVLVRFTPGSAQAYNGTITVNGDQTSGTNTIAVSGTGVTSSTPSGPRTQFGNGQWRVGTDIAAGRYFSDPTSSCYWERQRGLSGSLSDVIANEFVGFNALQWIVDIASSDVAFETEDCGTWFNTPRHPAQTSIPPGVWLVGSQISPGVYRTNASSGCYWERVSNFGGNLDAIIDNEFVGSASQQLVEIQSSDVGFHNDGDCGTWTRSSSLDAGESSTTSRTDLRRNREMHDRLRGAR